MPSLGSGTKAKKSVIVTKQPKRSRGSTPVSDTKQKLSVIKSADQSHVLDHSISSLQPPAKSGGVKRETIADEEVSLHCNEKIGDSPELIKVTATKTEAKIEPKPEPQVEIDLLKPLVVDESCEELKPNINFTLNEFGLLEVPKVQR